jgi:hypothetical protein
MIPNVLATTLKIYFLNLYISAATLYSFLMTHFVCLFQGLVSASVVLVEVRWAPTVASRSRGMQSKKFEESGTRFRFVLVKGMARMSFFCVLG